MVGTAEYQVGARSESHPGTWSGRNPGVQMMLPTGASEAADGSHQAVDVEQRHHVQAGVVLG